MTLVDVLPWWAGWLAPALYVGIATAWVLFYPSVPMRRIRREFRGAVEWPERAEIARQGRITLAMGSVVWLMPAILLSGWMWGSVSRVPLLPLTLAFGFAAVAKSIHAAWRFNRFTLGQPVPNLGAYWRTLLRKWWPLAGLIAVGAIAPSRLGSPWMVPWTLLAVGALLGMSYLAEMWIASGVARPGDARLTHLVNEAAAEAGVEPPRVVIVDSHATNAAAFPTRNLVIFTQRLLDELDDDEVKAIAFHEIAHLHEKWSVTRLRQIGLLGYLPFLAVKPLVGTALWALPAAMLGTVAIGFVLRRVNRTEEERADHAAIEASHASQALATGLLKAHRAGLMPTVVRGDPHGTLEERMQRAGVEPEFEPVPPRSPIRGVVGAALLGGLVVFAAYATVQFTLDPWDAENGSATAIAFGMFETEVLSFTGEWAALNGDFEKSVPYLEAAAADGDYAAISNLSWVLAELGRCDDLPRVRAQLENLEGVATYDLDLADSWYDYCLATQ